jgi:transcriptional regulator with XRE-family HTH domain
MTDEQERMIARRMGLRVRTGRAFKGLTREGLATRVGLPQSRLEQIETGFGRRVTADDLVTIAGALELPVWFFFEVPLDDTSPSVCPACGREWPA